MRRPRWTIRTRLTMLYTGVLILSGAGLLAVTYTLIQQALQVQVTSSAVVHSPDYETRADNPADEAERLRKNELYEQALLDDFRQQIVKTMISRGAAALGILAAAGVVVGWLVARHSLHPLQRITSTARRVANGNIQERIDLQGPNDELRELADTFDDMLSRLDEAFASQRRFVANASHELRTPLTINRTLIQVAMEHPDAPKDIRELAASLLKVNRRQQEIIDGLLTLATSEQPLTHRVPLDVAELVDTTIRLLAPEAEQRNVQVTTELGTSTVIGDPVLLERLVTNLVQNAIRHNNIGGGTARIAARPSHHHVVLTVENTGPDLDPARLEQIFEPFHRTETRSVSARGSGLGLSIARTVANAHGGSLSAKCRNGGGLIITALLPRDHGQTSTSAVVSGVS